MSTTDEYPNSHLIPHIEMNKLLYNCLRQISLAKKSKDMPQHIKDKWIEHAKAEFNKGIITDNYNNYKSFILLEKSIINENKDIIKYIEKHIAE